MRLNRRFLFVLIGSLLLILNPVHAQDDIHPLLQLLSYLPDHEIVTEREPVISYYDFGALYRAIDVTPPDTYDDIFDDDTSFIEWLTFNWLNNRVSDYSSHGANLLTDAHSEMQSTVGFDFFDIETTLAVGEEFGVGSLYLFFTGEFDIDTVETALDGEFERIMVGSINEEFFSNENMEYGSTFGNPFIPADRMPNVNTLIDVYPNLVVGTISEDLWGGFWRLYDLSQAGVNSGLYDNNSEITALAQALVDTGADILHVQIHNATISDAIASAQFPTLYPDIDLDDIGELPAYSFVALADMQSDGMVINSIALVYDSIDDAEQAAKVVADRLLIFDVEDLYDVHEVEMLEPMVQEFDGQFVALISVAFPEVILEDSEGSDRPLKTIIKTWLDRKSTLLPIWING